MNVRTDAQEGLLDALEGLLTEALQDCERMASGSFGKIRAARDGVRCLWRPRNRANRSAKIGVPPRFAQRFARFLCRQRHLTPSRAALICLKLFDVLPQSLGSALRARTPSRRTEFPESVYALQVVVRTRSRERPYRRLRESPLTHSESRRDANILQTYKGFVVEGDAGLQNRGLCFANQHYCEAGNYLCRCDRT